MTTLSTRSSLPQRISITIGAIAAITAVGVTLVQPPQIGASNAHAKFDVITVVAQPSATAPATVTETDKPHELQVTKATPQIRAPRTVISKP